MLAAVNADFPAFDVQRFMQRNGLQVFDSHFFGHGDNVAQFVHLAHGVVEDGGDDAAVAVAGRSGVALAEFEVADEDSALFIEGKFEVHAVGIVWPAGEAIVLWQFEVTGFVAVELLEHGRFYRGCVRKALNR